MSHRSIAAVKGPSKPGDAGFGRRLRRELLLSCREHDEMVTIARKSASKAGGGTPWCQKGERATG
jgi:hypothetical protein